MTKINFWNPKIDATKSNKNNTNKSAACPFTPPIINVGINNVNGIAPNIKTEFKNDFLFFIKIASSVKENIEKIKYCTYIVPLLTHVNSMAIVT